jgi:adenosine deaminase
MGDDGNDALLCFCRRMPKVELHAHLNGCVRDITIRELAAQILGDDRAFQADVVKLTSAGARKWLPDRIAP